MAAPAQPPSTTPNRDQTNDILKEYELLKAEIMENSRLIATVFIANTGITASIIAYALTRSGGGGPVFLAPLAILIPSLMFIGSQLEQTTIISQYLRIILEPKLGVRWQTNWYDLREAKLLIVSRKYIPAVSGLYGSLSVVCLFLAAVTWKDAAPWLRFGVVIVVGVILILAVAVIQRAFDSFREQIADGWKKLRDLQAMRESAGLEKENSA